MPRPKQHLTAAEEKKIRTFLNMAPHQPFLRCKGKSRRRLAEFRKAGDRSHEAPDHMCDECRCTNIAGSGTMGDLYGVGINIGHFGTGYCAVCEKTKRKEFTTRAWQEDMKMLQETGSVTTTTDIQVKAEQESAVAQQNFEVQDAINRVYEAVRKFEELESLDETTWITGKGGTEISDAEKAELVMKKNRLMLEQARTLDQLAKTKFEFSRDLHIPVDVMRIWIVKVMNILEKYTYDRTDYDKAVSELKKAVNETRNANMMMAGHEASVERKEKSVE